MKNSLRKARTMGALGVLLVITSGCIQNNVGVKVYEDGSADVNVRVAVDYEKFSSVSGMFGDMGGDSAPDEGTKMDVCDEFTMEGGEASSVTLPGGVTQKPFKDDKWCGVDITGKVTDLRDINNVLLVVNDAGVLNADMSTGLSEIDLSAMTAAQAFDRNLRSMAAFGDAENNNPNDTDPRKPHLLLDLIAMGDIQDGYTPTAELMSDHVRVLLYNPAGSGAGRWTRLFCSGSAAPADGYAGCPTVSQGSSSASLISDSSDTYAGAWVAGHMQNPTRATGPANVSNPAPMCLQFRSAGKDAFLGVSAASNESSIIDEDINTACPEARYGNSAPSTPTPAISGTDYTDLSTTAGAGAPANDTRFGEGAGESGTSDDATIKPGEAMQFEKLASGGWSFKMTDPLSCAEESSADSSLDDLGSMGEALLADFQLKFDIQLPGVPGANNATSVDGNTFTWKLGYKDLEKFCKGDDVTFNAVTTPGSLPGDGGSKLPLVLGGVALLALLGGGGAAAAMKRRSGSSIPQNPTGGAAMYQAPQPQSGDATWNEAAMHAELREARVTPALPPATPVWDASLGAWVVTSPTGGTFVFDATTQQWMPKA
jgi:hypothetical protein